jgi:hypothetical protein
MAPAANARKHGVLRSDLLVSNGYAANVLVDHQRVPATRRCSPTFSVLYSLVST